MNNPGTQLNDALIAGAAGAVTLTVVHQAARIVTDIAPRMDVLGMRALARGAESAGGDPPDEHGAGLYSAAMAGDLLVNSAYYALATSWTKGAALGLLAGTGALLLPQRLGLGHPPHSERLANKVMTVAWYVAGGLAAAATARYLGRRRAEARQEFARGDAGMKKGH
jgi:hypothetical protein